MRIWVDSENGQNLDKWTKLKKSLLLTKLSITSSITAKNHHFFFLLKYDIYVYHLTKVWSLRPFSWIQKRASRVKLGAPKPHVCADPEQAVVYQMMQKLVICLDWHSLWIVWCLFVCWCMFQLLQIGSTKLRPISGTFYWCYTYSCMESHQGQLSW